MRFFSLKHTAIIAMALIAPLTAAEQQLPGKHPYYLHALSDLRAARWFLYHQPGNSAVSSSEDVAITEIDAVIGELKRAAIDDGKDVNDHPAIDVKEHGSRLLKSIELLKKIKADISKEEDNPEARELRHKAHEHLNLAIKAAEKAHADWLKEIKK